MRILPLCLMALVACGRAPGTPPSQPAKPKTGDEAPAREDAAKIYEAQSWKEVEIPESVMTYRPPDIAARDEVDRVLAGSKDRLLALEKAARAPRCDWKPARIDLFADRPHVPGALKAWRLLRVSFLRRMESGDKRAAAETLVTGLKTAVDHTTHPSLIVKLIGCVGVALMTDALQSTISVHAFDRAELEFLEKQLAKLPERVPGASRVFADEVLCLRASLDPLLDMGFAKAMKFLSASERESEHTKHVDEILSRDKAASRAAIAKRIDEFAVLMAQDVAETINSPRERFKSKEYQEEAVREFAVDILTPPYVPARQLEVASKTVAAILAPAHLKLRKPTALARLKLEFVILWTRLQKLGLDRRSYPKSLEGPVAPVRDPFDGGSIKYMQRDFDTRSVFVLAAAGPKNDWNERLQKYQSRT